MHKLMLSLLLIGLLVACDADSRPSQSVNALSADSTGIILPDNIANICMDGKAYQIIASPSALYRNTDEKGGIIPLQEFLAADRRRLVISVAPLSTHVSLVTWCVQNEVEP